MAPLLVAVSLLLGPPAHAITTDHAGSYLEAVGGLAVGTSPVAAHLGWQVHAGGWFGPYDHAYALGRYHAVGAALRQDLAGDSLRSAVMVEYRRGMALFVAGSQLQLAAGPELIGSDVGVAARVGVGGKFRFFPRYGAVARIEGGVGTAGGLNGQFALVIGLAWTTPLWSREEVDPEVP